MHMHIDESGHDQTSGGIDGLRRAIDRYDIVLRSGGNDFPPVDGNRAMLNEANALSRHREEMTTAN
jgi:hypothetical protein